MLFNSIHFLIFFPIVVLLYFIIPRKVKYIWLLISSYYFYMSWNAKYALLLLASTMITWGCGLLINHVQKTSLRKLVLILGLVSNFSFLFYFKYFNFFWENLSKILQKIHLTLPVQSFSILLPVGISFFIFQAVGYMIDVYRKTIEPEKNPLRYALFVSFFPQLVAGPIERSGNLLKQMQEIETKKLWNYDNIVNGFILMIWGLFIKMVVADRVAILVDTVFGYYFQFGTISLAAGAIGFALQIYGDFMGYSTIAIGAAKVMGFELMENFNTPYFATSVSDFWHRWHISLSTWFRDYVYIPLGGNRCGKFRKYLNLMITFLVSGLWHGAAWNYVVWGMLHGIFQVVGDLTKDVRNKLYKITNTKTESFSFLLGKILGTFFWVDLAWIFFRAGSLKVALEYCFRLFTKWDPWSLFNGEIYTLGLERQELNILVIGAIMILLTDIIRSVKKQSIAEFLCEQNIWFRWLIMFGLIGSIIVFGIYGIDFDSTQFIYFQF